MNLLLRVGLSRGGGCLSNSQLLKHPPLQQPYDVFNHHTEVVPAPTKGQWSRCGSVTGSTPLPRPKVGLKFGLDCRSGDWSLLKRSFPQPPVEKCLAFQWNLVPWAAPPPPGCLYPPVSWFPCGLKMQGMLDGISSVWHQRQKAVLGAKCLE